VKNFHCRNCDAALYFENSVCVGCGSALGYSRSEAQIVPVEGGVYVDDLGYIWHVCRNLNLSGCTWLTTTEGGQCFVCDLTRTRPADDDETGLEQLVDAERAKRQLIAELDGLGFPLVGKPEDPAGGLAFDLLSSVDENVVIGHENGVITIDLAESDDAYREKVRDQLDEPYRTMLGHLRHEIGHYFEWQLVETPGGDLLDRARELFGDETADYQASVQRHYDRGGPPEGWQDGYISSYATMHPYEDFAESWAHYLHICDSVETAVEYGLVLIDRDLHDIGFRELVTRLWMTLSTALNMMNRSMGLGDLYPFVLPEPVIEKLEFVASLRPAD